jgi:hypothetical protein
MPYSRIALILFMFVNLSVFSQSSEQLYNEANTLRESDKDSKAIKKFEEALAKAESEKNISVQMNAHIALAEL